MSKHRHAPKSADEAKSSESFLTVSALARRWNVDRHTVSLAIHSGRLQAFKPGGPDGRVYRILESEVVRYEREHMATAVA